MSDFKEDILKGRVALITGGATGIGKEISRTLGKHGARIVITSRKQENLDAARDEFEKEGIDCLTVSSDVRNPEAVEGVIASTLEKYGSLNIVINCAINESKHSWCSTSFFFNHSYYISNFFCL